MIAQLRVQKKEKTSREFLEKLKLSEEVNEKRDQFGNIITYNADHGTIKYKDNFGITWVFNTIKNEFAGSFQDEEGSMIESWKYDIHGNTEYTNLKINMKWKSYQNGTKEFWDLDNEDYVRSYNLEGREFFYDDNGYLRPQNQGQEYIYKSLSRKEETETVRFNFDGEDSLEWSENWYQGNYWLWDQTELSWLYTFGKKGTSALVSYKETSNKHSDIEPEVCLKTNAENSVCYSVLQDQWMFINSKNSKYYYYPEWSWGTKNQEWYLLDEKPDQWIVPSDNKERKQKEFSHMELPEVDC